MSERERRGRMPVVQQLAATDCGAACLTMVLRFFGRHTSLDEVKTVLGTGRDGATAYGLTQAARHFGLIARGVSLDVDALDCLPRGAVLHWAFQHFVVLDRARPDGIDVVDPAVGRRRVSRSDLRKDFTGVAVLFEPSNLFEARAKGQSALWRYLRRVLSEPGLIARVLVLSLVLQALALGLPALTGLLVDTVLPRGDVRLLHVVGVGLAGLVTCRFLASLVRSNLLVNVRTLLDARLTSGFVDHLVRLPHAYFQSRMAGDLLMRVNNVALVRETLSTSLLSGVLDGVLAMLYLALLFASSPTLGLLAMALALADAGLFLLSARRQRELTAETLQVEARAQGVLTELVTGIGTHKALGSELAAAEQWMDRYVDSLNVGVARGRFEALVWSLMAAVRAASPLALLCWGGWSVMRGELGLGAMLALNAVALGFLVPASSLVEMALRWQSIRSYVDRMEEVFTTPPEQAPGAEVPASIEGRITLDGVSFQYGPTSQRVVHGVSADIPPGTFVALVGRSGCGKSTLLRLVLGLLRPVEGRVLVDGADLFTLDLRAHRRRLGVVTQDAELFSMTIRDNIALSDPSAPIEAVRAAATLAQVDDDIMAMPMGYETLLVEGGASLSGGQRQRVALARALAHRPPVLLLDEATSALDAVTEAKVHEALASLRCTRLVAAHRLSTVARADLILVLEDGKVVERGTHDELVAQGGSYAALVRGQMQSEPGGGK